MSRGVHIGLTARLLTHNEINMLTTSSTYGHNVFFRLGYRSNLQLFSVCHHVVLHSLSPFIAIVAARHGAIPSPSQLF